jgi:hypothetical protein
MYTFYSYLYMWMIYGQELQAQLQKSDRTSHVAPEKIYIMGGISVGYIAVHMDFLYHLLINVDIHSNL